MTRYALLFLLTGCTPMIGGYQYGTPDDDDHCGDCSPHDTTDDDDDTTDTTDTNDGSGDGDGGGWVVDEEGGHIAHLDDCDLREGELRSYLDEESGIAYRLGRATGTFWAHGQLGEDANQEIPSDFFDWDRQGAFHSDDDRICAIVFQWDGCGPFARSSTTAISSTSHDLDDEPFHQRAVDMGAWWPGIGGSDAQAELATELAVAKVCGKSAEVIADYWCWPGAYAGCGTGLIALDPDLDESYETELYRGH